MTLLAHGTGATVGLIALGATVVVLAIVAARALRRLSDTHARLYRMTREMNERHMTLQQQRNEMEGVLASMIEGVLAVDLDEKIISYNRAAAVMLGIDVQGAVGRSIQEVVRNTAVQQFVAQAVGSETPLQDDLVLRLSAEVDDVRELYVQAQGATLRNSTGERIGALVVLHDVTRLQRLEVVRRDFVANVSHELKTPITAIKGSVETLLEDVGDVSHGRQFLEIIARQADRLNAIVDDLLSLARIEQGDRQERVEVTEQRVAEVLAGAVDACRVQADARRITVRCECEPTLIAPINPPLMEQATINLIDNAIKYSPEQTEVVVAGERRDGELLITVRDHGVGIESEHLPRLFERFYRTDKARSRSLGGTGLGLAIVKHIAQSHHGRVSVESAVGKGSTFCIHVPC